jgi:hypothetical protein
MVWGVRLQGEEVDSESRAERREEGVEEDETEKRGEYGARQRREQKKISLRDR